MEVKNLSFFDSRGYNLNFEWNDTLEAWEGIIYLPKVSVGLYTNTNIYVMEKVGDGYFFPQKNGSDDTIRFSWDILNTFVDEFFMFDFDMGYYGSNEFDTSALVYKPNNGPEAETLIVKRFDEYEIELDDTQSKKALPIHVAFSSPDKYDATTFNRTLDMYYGRRKIASITFFAETIEEDERLEVLNKNMGYDIKPKDVIIFKDSDIKECYPDYRLLNEKRKELMIEGHNIYPYIGSYRAIINVIKFFGYENLNIIEYWRNVDINSEYFGKVFATSKYSLTKKEALNVSGQAIPLPNRDYRKLNNISLVYTINHPVDKYDELELPLVVEDFDYTMEEVMIKLFALRRKLNDEFMPCSSRIVDIIGEGNYFGLEDIVNTVSSSQLKTEKNRIHHPRIKVFPSEEIFTPTFKNEGGETYDYRENAPSDFVFPTCVTHISENRGFIQYLTEIENDSDFDDNNTYELNRNTALSSISNLTLGDIADIPSEGDAVLNSSYVGQNGFTNHALGDEYEDFCRLIGEGYRNDNPFEPLHHNEIDTEKTNPTAKVVLENISFDEITFGQIPETFGVFDNTGITFGNIDTTYYGYSGIKWSVSVSSDQTDDDLARLGIERVYEPDSGYTATTGFHDIEEYRKVMLELPYAGYYDITMTFKNSEDYEVEYVFVKAVKVELYNLDIRGFYYDARELPEDLQYDMEAYGIPVGDNGDSEPVNEYKEFIMTRLKEMTSFAIVERMDDMHDMNKDMTMPLYGEDSEDGQFIVHPGPYSMNYINTHWYLLDNISWNITSLDPELNLPNARYIKNAVDVKPYTWFLLGFNESKITSVENPKWTLTNLATNEFVEYYGNYFTILLKKEGDYRIDLELDDTNGNHYSVSRVIVIVDYDANYRLYRRFKEDYDAYVEERDRIDARLYSEFATLNTMVEEE